MRDDRVCVELLQFIGRLHVDMTLAMLWVVCCSNAAPNSAASNHERRHTSGWDRALLHQAPINDRAEACSRWFRSPESPDHEGSGKRTRICVLREESDTVANVQCPELMRSRQDAFACSASCWSFLTGGSRKMASATADLAAGSCFDRRHFRA